MKTRSEKMNVSVLSLAVQGALAAMCATPMMAAAADGDDVAALTQPTNTIEVGAAYQSKDSAKFGEYSGLNDKGGVFIGNFSVRGGDAYGSGKGTTRWGISGTDLGTTSRGLSGSVSNQGKWNLGFGYDELRHNISDTYQTPQQGNMGGNTFTFPAGFGTFNGAAPPALATRSLSATQLGAFHTEEVSTTRKNTSFAGGFNFNPQWGLQFDFNRLNQSGAKLLGVASRGGEAATTGTWRAEAVNILMNPTNYTTDNFNVALNWVGAKGHVTGSYFGSSFSDGYDRLSGQNSSLSSASTCVAPCTFQTTTMSTAPDNKAHQWNLNGGYVFSPATKLTGGISYGRNTQNAGFLTGFTEIVAAPQSSLNGLVVTKHADLKLTHQATRDLSLRAGYKHNERDNRTASNMYSYYAINGGAPTDVATNAPYSNKKTEFELAGDYRVKKGHLVQLAYTHDKTSRWCNSMANGFNNCLVSPSNNEDKFGIKYKLKATDKLGLNAGYTYAKRKATFDHNAVTPLAGLDVAVPTDVNAQDYPGFINHIYASRKQDMLKAGLNWQASDKLDLGLNGRYADDKYYDSTLGVQNGRTTGINLDATYNYKDNNSVAAYWSWQNSKRDLRSGASGSLAPNPAAVNAAATYAALVAPTNIWTNQLKDDSTAVGINSKHSGLMGGKLEIKGDLSYSFDKTSYDTQLQYVLASCAATNLTSCGPLPDIKSRVFTFKLTGAYQLDKKSKIAFGYVFQQRRTEDYYYNTLLYGYTPNRVMPTNEQAPNYSVSLVSASYVYSFK